VKNISNPEVSNLARKSKVKSRKLDCKIVVAGVSKFEEILMEQGSSFSCKLFRNYIIHCCGKKVPEPRN